jgi:glutamine amidotransferase
MPRWAQPGKIIALREQRGKTSCGPQGQIKAGEMTRRLKATHPFTDRVLPLYWYKKPFEKLFITREERLFRLGRLRSLMIAIVDYGMGNLFSIYNATMHVGGSPQVIQEPAALREADGIIVPGVGAFGKCMEHLARFREGLFQALEQGTPLFGICIGLQVLFEESEESPGSSGLGWIKGRVVRLPEGVMIPQMGWNGLFIRRQVDILDGIEQGDMFYFVHSYHCVPEDESLVAATTEHGADVTAVVARDNLCATQFHPEKSGEKGLRILENFVRSTRC